MMHLKLQNHSSFVLKSDTPVEKVAISRTVLKPKGSLIQVQNDKRTFVTLSKQ